jgi:hypothetical protein
MSAAAATQEAIWLRAFLGELGFKQAQPTKIGEDNQGCIALTRHDTAHCLRCEIV